MEISSFCTIVPKMMIICYTVSIWSDDVRFLRYDAQWTDERTERQMDGKSDLWRWVPHLKKSILVFLLNDRKASQSPLPSSFSLLSSSTVQPENTYSCTLKVTGQVWESQKGMSINTTSTATTSINLPKSVSTDLTIKSDSVLINPIGNHRVLDWSM